MTHFGLGVDFLVLGLGAGILIVAGGNLFSKVQV